MRSGNPWYKRSLSVRQSCLESNSTSSYLPSIHMDSAPSCLTCQRIRKKACPGYATSDQGIHPCDECARLRLECLAAIPGGRPVWFHDQARLAEARRAIADWLNGGHQRTFDAILPLSPILAPPVPPGQSHNPPDLHTLGQPELLQAINDLDLNPGAGGPSTVTELRFLLPLLQFILTKNISGIRGLCFVIGQDDRRARLLVEDLIRQYRQGHADEFIFRVSGHGTEQY
ncbi:uncharacterized protein EI90DRAFT_3091061 [Cantharellus anzutake]|uniref:uncharacterized protein n=1 Tax=Cantharellus anzutake TaxID=1750568 RepID=UPI0019044FF9|nr:uncharacterized protein EI90DRAFT_3091061 [Cantharellus anzutake]KAF8313955.1 hypothetical protein EI90DRAFT_3091061 [Cantharellus anzutake]